MNGYADVVVLGGGISGLAASHGALSAGASVLLLEAGAAVGGVMRTETIDGFLVEHGPTSMAISDSVRTLLNDIGLAAQMVAPSVEAKRRYVVRDGTMHSLPSSPAALLRSALLSTRGKVRLLAEPFMQRAQSNHDESLGALVRRRFGPEVLDYLVDPFVSGVCAGDAMQLSKRFTLRALNELELQHGSVLVGAIKNARHGAAKSASEIVSLGAGMQQLAEALSRSILEFDQGELCANACVTRVVHAHDSWQVHYNVAGRRTVVESSAVVCALPSHQLAPVSWPEQWIHSLSQMIAVRSAPIATVALGFRRSDIQHKLDGFGTLFPSAERGPILGALFNSSMFANRAPAGHCLITAFVGGCRAPAAPSAAEAIHAALSALTPLLGITAAPVMTHVARWDAGIPQLEVGHNDVLAAAADIEQRAPNAFFTGSYLSGVAIGDCLAHGVRTGNRAAAPLLRHRSGHCNILARVSG